MSPAELTARAANAQHSTGPRSPEGKAISSRNALKFGLFSQAAVLPGEDPAELEQLARDFEGQFHPAGILEAQLVNDLVEGTWLQHRYQRIANEVMSARCAALSPTDRAYPMAAIFTQDAAGHNILEKLHRRRQAAIRQYQRALTVLIALQSARQMAAPEPDSIPVTTNPVNAIPTSPVRFDKPVITSGPTPVRTPKDNWDNPALRL